MKKNLIIWLVVALLVALTTTVLAAPAPKLKADCPLPKEVNISPLGADVPPELAAFFGTWVGTWEWDFYPANQRIKRDAVIIVEKIDGTSVHMVFAWGDLRPYYRNPTVGWARVVGTYNTTTNKVTVPLKEPLVGANGDATLWITADGKMAGYRSKILSEASDYKGIYAKQ